MDMIRLTGLFNAGKPLQAPATKLPESGSAARTLHLPSLHSSANKFLDWQLLLQSFVTSGSYLYHERYMIAQNAITIYQLYMNR